MFIPIKIISFYVTRLKTVENFYIKRTISEHEIIDYLLKKDEELSIPYTIYQDFLYAIDKRDFKLFNSLIENH